MEVLFRRGHALAPCVKRAEEGEAGTSGKCENHKKENACITLSIVYAGRMTLEVQCKVRGSDRFFPPQVGAGPAFPVTMAGDADSLYQD